MATLHTRPDGAPPIQLEVPPRLASWNKVGDPERDRLDLYLSHVHELATRYVSTDLPLALELHVGMGLRPLAHESDLEQLPRASPAPPRREPVLGGVRGKGA
ncbi:MAG: hypothetical protein LC749_06760 [Actinobacteria bacterium]|nr:hypothetical protein [Actinomycetota bacterium]